MVTGKEKELSDYTFEKWSAECNKIVNQVDIESKATNLYVLTTIQGIVAMVSIFSLLIVVHSIFTKKELKMHPSPLIAAICIFEAIMTWNSFISFLMPKYVVCYFNIWESFAILGK